MLFILLALSPANGKPVVGEAAPQLAGKELDGTPFDAAKMKGKIVLVHFWATWCPECHEEMGELDSFYRAYHARGVEILAISVDKSRIKETVLDAMKPLAFPAALVADCLVNEYGPPPILPLTYVIDGNGIVRARLSPDEQPVTAKLLADTVDPLLKEIRKAP